MSYDQIDREESRPRAVRDHSDTWSRLASIRETNGTVRASVEAFCARKRVSVEALEALGVRYAVRREVPCVAFAGGNGNGRVVAIKYRPLNGSSHESFAEAPSNWLRPIVAGNRDSMDWLVAEGETDAARLYELAGDHAAILVLPAGARTFKPEWAALIPRGATVALCHDADSDGDAGAAKAARIIGGKTIRLRPPIEGGDWCDWSGDSAAFEELHRNAGGTRRRTTRAKDVHSRRVRWAWPGYMPLGYLTIQSGETKIGKTTFFTWVAGKITRGELPGELEGRPSEVLIVATEDNRDDMWKPRLVAAGADLDLIAFFNAPDGWDVQDASEVAAALDETPAPLLFVDAVMEHLPPPARGETSNSSAFDTGEEAQVRGWLGDPAGRESYYEEQRRSLRPGTYNRLHLNLWQTSAEAFLTGEDWDRCVFAHLRPFAGVASGLPVFVGVDVGMKKDCTAVVVVAWSDGDGDDRMVRVIEHRIWRNRPGEVLDLFATAVPHVRELFHRYHVRRVLYDPSQFLAAAAVLASEAPNRGTGTFGTTGDPEKERATMQELSQTVPNLTRATDALYTLVKTGQLAVYEADDLRQHVLNAVAVESAAGWRLAKEKASRKIDGAVALSFACLAAVSLPPEAEPVAVAVETVSSSYTFAAGAPLMGSVYGA